ncbi:MAG: NAD(P)/FAD-dependent oxidoreductase [Akkermansiaceae bacterium]|nr:NAD(P)/FAD-dependent oxidoreductase [Akkermansiaceae bacterium]
MPDTERFDLILIGSGTAAQTFLSNLDDGWMGKRIALIEEREPGGTCALRGCQPKKFLVEVADAVARARMLKGLGVAGDARFDWKAMQRHKNEFLDGIPEETVESLEEDGVEVVRGRAAFVDEDAVAVDGRRLAADHFIVAAGSRPRRLDLTASELVVDSSGFLDLEDLPDEVVFIGGGYIAMEFAHVAARAGAAVTMLIRSGSVLSGFDPDCIDAVVAESREAGIDFRFHTTPEAMSPEGDGILIETGGGETMRAKLVVEAVGRIPNTDRLDAETAGIELDRGGAIVVDDRMRSVSNKRIIALGDIAAAGADLAPVADIQAKTAACHLMGDRTAAMDYRVVPTNAFTIPNLARVGLLEEEAGEKGADVRVSSGPVAGWATSMRIGEKHGFYKVLIDDSTGEILGAHLARHAAAETINLFALAMKQHVRAAEMGDLAWAYPTFSSDIKRMVKDSR